MNKGHPDPRSAEVTDRGAQRVALAGGIEPTFGSALGPPLRNNAGRVGADFAGDRDHLGRRRHFEIERLVDAGLQPHDVVVEDMAAILAQMRRDAVGPGRDRDCRRPHRIRMPPAARITHGGDVVDVDAEAEGWV